MNGWTGHIRDAILSIGILLCCLYAGLYAMAHNLSFGIAVAYVVGAGVLPWLLYNAVASIFRFERSHISLLIGFLIDLILG